MSSHSNSEVYRWEQPLYNDVEHSGSNVMAKDIAATIVWKAVSMLLWDVVKYVQTYVIESKKLGYLHIMDMHTNSAQSYNCSSERICKCLYKQRFHRWFKK